jgi:hypothetical protein
MAGLLDQAGSKPSDLKNLAEEAHQVWEENMLRSIESLKDVILTSSPDQLSFRSGAQYENGIIRLSYWESLIIIDWPELDMRDSDETPLSIFDKTMIMYYLKTADGAEMADRWIGFRELPDGGFYNQAFQGYSGDRLARFFGDEPENLVGASARINGTRLPALADFAFAFQPLPRIRLAAVLWPGDDEFPSKASILFDASSSHYLTTDGLALLGSGLVRRLEKAAQ